MFKTIDVCVLDMVTGGEGNGFPTEIAGEKVDCIPTGRQSSGGAYTGFPDLSAPGVGNGAQDAFCASTKSGHAWNIRRVN